MCFCPGKVCLSVSTHLCNSEDSGSLCDPDSLMDLRRVVGFHCVQLFLVWMGVTLSKLLQARLQTRSHTAIFLEIGLFIAGIYNVLCSNM